MPLRIPIVCAVRCWDSHHVMYSSSYLTEPTITCPYRPVSLRLSHSHSGLQWNEHKNLFWYYDFFGWAIFFFFLIYLALICLQSLHYAQLLTPISINLTDIFFIKTHQAFVNVCRRLKTLFMFVFLCSPVRPEVDIESFTTNHSPYCTYMFLPFNFSPIFCCHMRQTDDIGRVSRSHEYPNCPNSIWLPIDQKNDKYDWWSLIVPVYSWVAHTHTHTIWTECWNQLHHPQ